MPFAGSIKVFYLFKISRKSAIATIFLKKGEIWPIDDPPTKKQNRVLNITVISYYPGLSRMSFLPYQNPKE